jgi:hypothetical protein
MDWDTEYTDVAGGSAELEDSVSGCLLVSGVGDQTLLKIEFEGGKIVGVDLQDSPDPGLFGLTHDGGHVDNGLVLVGVSWWMRKGEGSSVVFVSRC